MFLLERGLKNTFATGLLVRVIIIRSEWVTESPPKYPISSHFVKPWMIQLP